jgi:hypothetical protein
MQPEPRQGVLGCFWQPETREGALGSITPLLPLLAAVARSVSGCRAADFVHATFVLARVAATERRKLAQEPIARFPDGRTVATLGEVVANLVERFTLEWRLGRRRRRREVEHGRQALDDVA